MLALYESNTSTSRVYTSKIQHESEFAEVNKALYEWFTLACSKNIYPEGPQLSEKAAEKLGKPTFKASRVGYFSGRSDTM